MSKLAREYPVGAALEQEKDRAGVHADGGQDGVDVPNADGPTGVGVQGDDGQDGVGAHGA